MSRMFHTTMTITCNEHVVIEQIAHNQPYLNPLYCDVSPMCSFHNYVENMNSQSSLYGGNRTMADLFISWWCHVLSTDHLSQTLETFEVFSSCP